MGNLVFFDLKDRDLSVYTFGKNGKSGSPVESRSVPVGEDHSFRLDIRAENGGESVLSLPLSLLNFRVIELPFSDAGKIRELLPFELDGLVLGGSGNVIFDASVLGEQGGKAQVLVTYIEKGVLGPILGNLKASGFDPATVTSIELGRVLRSSSNGNGLTERLVSPEPLTEGERDDAAAREADEPTINLRRGEFVYTADSDRTKRRWRLTAGLAATVMLFFMIYMASVTLVLRKQNDEIRDSIRKTYTGLFPSEKRITDETYQLKAHIRELKDKENSFVGVSPLKVFLALSTVGGRGTVLNEISIDRDSVLIKGESPSLSDVQRFTGDLEGLFSDVTISDTKPSLQNRTTLFTVTAREKAE